MAPASAWLKCTTSDRRRPNPSLSSRPYGICFDSEPGFSGSRCAWGLGWARPNRHRLLRTQACFAGVTFVMEMAAAQERHLVEHPLLERFQGEVNDRRDVEGN